MTHWGDSFSQGVRLLRIIDHDGREQVLSIRTGEAGWTTRRIATDGSTEDVTLRRRELRIGRDRAADLVFKDPTVAGQHCRSTSGAATSS
jgi:pSer/pThr/pTyr-binding forkhead associated (FHA) protein